MSGNTDVSHVLVPIVGLTGTDPKPPAWPKRNSISSATSSGSVMKCHAALPADRQISA